MHNIIGKRTLQVLAGGALMVFASLASAQYVWIDDKGTKQFSDRAPPASVPAKNILKQPSGTAAPAAAASPAPSAAKESGPTLAERELDYRKRAKEKAEADKKASDTAAQQATKKSNCDGASAYQRQLEQGSRIRVTDKNGQEGFMDDAARAAEVARAKKIAQESCGT